MAARTLFVMLYAGATEGVGRWLRPDQVTKMTTAQSRRVSHTARLQWVKDSMSPGKLSRVHGAWYAANTREPIRDETLRAGLVALGAVIERQGLPTTSARPRYALAAAFMELLACLLSNKGSAKNAISDWQRQHLSTAAMGRIHLLRSGTVASHGTGKIVVTFPNGEGRVLAPGPSAVITKAVIEVFATRFLREPGVVFLSESGQKVVARDDTLANAIGLKLDYARHLPDIILADVDPTSPKVVFIEVVATDGAVTQQRKAALLATAIDGGYPPSQIHFVTAFMDRRSPAFRKLVAEIAWGTLAWFVSEPTMFLHFRESGAEPQASLVL